MFDSNEYLNSLFNNDYSSTTVADTENEIENQTTYSPQSDYSSQTSMYERDDYSSAQNYTEQTSYESISSNLFSEPQTQVKTSSMNTPMIERSAPVVNLVKSKARIRLETRMKIVLSVFSVIVACLLFISIFNFISAHKIEASFLGKQQQINNLEQSILEAKNSYNSVTSEEYIDNWAKVEGFKDKNEENTIVVKLGEFYEEPVVEEVPTNWFNNVCEFFSKLFA